MLVPSSTLNGFKLYQKKPNAIRNGFLYTKEITIPSLMFNKNRTIRLFLPDYFFIDENKDNYSVLFFLDGQNMVDKYTTLYGEWNLDKTLNKLYKKENKHVILVGIDCANGDLERTLEYSPSLFDYKNIYKKGIDFNIYKPIGENIASFIALELKPLIEKTLNMTFDKQHTGIGGSSMGGLESFYIFNTFNNIFGFCLCFSPAFHLIKKQSLFSFVKSKDELGKLFLYSGGGDKLENLIYKDALNLYSSLITKKKFDKTQLAFIFDSTKIHHERSWEIYSYPALKFLIKE